MSEKKPPPATGDHDGGDAGARVAEPGTLYIVPTPIGHPDDISIRAINILCGVDIIAAEDTRVTGMLLVRHQIRTRLISCHEHNEAGRVEGLIRRLQSGASVALVSDAGTPCVSDPGYRLAAAAADAGIRVSPLPGPAAAVCALSASGLPSDAFAFSGFPPRKQKRRRDWLMRLAAAPETRIFYESPRRVIRFLGELLELFGDRSMAAARELTKIREEILRGRISEVRAVLAARNAVKGEFTLVVAGAGDGCAAQFPEKGNDGHPAAGDANPAARLDRSLRQALSSGTEPPSVLSRRIARTFGLSRREVYAAAVSIQKEMQPQKQ
ncbi:MAG: 16S rRNA (cytidine(1402)-2'-O)-methyltransferase [Desulfobacterales bacterium]|nr:MAG: 16S rRNA (cytidine(1402)-2'-O)-methyltransferase [Desulfobacterales bacterium]